MKQNFESCIRQARLLTKEYRLEAPDDFDPQNYVATTVVLIVAAVAAIASASVSAYGMYQQGQAQKQIADYNAKVAKNGAVAARQEAEAQASLIRTRNLRIRGASEAAASKSGVTLSGSVSDVLNDSAIQGEMDALTSIYKGYRGAQSGLAQAELDRYQGREAGSIAGYGATSTLIGGFAQGASYGTAAYNSSRITSQQNAPQINP